MNKTFGWFGRATTRPSLFIPQLRTRSGLKRSSMVHSVFLILRKYLVRFLDKRF